MTDHRSDALGAFADGAKRTEIAMLQSLLSGEELKSLRLAISRSPYQPEIPPAHEVKLRRLGLVRETEGGLGATDKGWMALSPRGLAAGDMTLMHP